MKDIEILAINDGSTDNSLNILDSLSLRYKGKLKIISKENGGAGSARNIGIENANGEFIKFVDADDYLKLDILDRMYNIAKENHVSLVRGNYQTILGPIKMDDKCSWSNIGDLRFPENTKWEDLAIMPVVVASSERLFHMDENVYNYRVNMNTTIKDFINKIPNILDIIKCVETLEKICK